MLRTVTDLRSLVRWTVRQGGVDDRRVGIVGHSLGGVLSSLVVAMEPNFAAGVLVMSSAGLHEVFASCANRAQRARRSILANLDWTMDDFRNSFEELLRPIEPLRYVGSIPAERVLLIDAAREAERRRSSIRGGSQQVAGKPFETVVVVGPDGNRIVDREAGVAGRSGKKAETASQLRECRPSDHRPRQATCAHRRIGVRNLAQSSGRGLR